MARLLVLLGFALAAIACDRYPSARSGRGGEGGSGGDGELVCDGKFVEIGEACCLGSQCPVGTTCTASFGSCGTSWGTCVEVPDETCQRLDADHIPACGCDGQVHHRSCDRGDYADWTRCGIPAGHFFCNDDNCREGAEVCVRTGDRLACEDLGPCQETDNPRSRADCFAEQRPTRCPDPGITVGFDTDVYFVCSPP